MNFALIEDAKSVILKSWASRLAFASAIFGALAELQPNLSLLQGLVPDSTFKLLSLACVVAVPLARVIKQESISGA